MLDALHEAEHDARLREVLREQRAVEVAPGDVRLERRERNAADCGPQDRSAAVRDSPGADPLAVNVGPRREALMQRTHVPDLGRPVEGDDAARLAVAACVEGEDGV